MATENSESLLKEFFKVWAITLAKNGGAALVAIILAVVTTAILCLPVVVWIFIQGYNAFVFGGQAADAPPMPLHWWVAQGVWFALVISGVWSALEVLD